MARMQADALLRHDLLRLLENPAVVLVGGSALSVVILKALKEYGYIDDDQRVILTGVMIGGLTAYAAGSAKLGAVAGIATTLPEAVQKEWPTVAGIGGGAAVGTMIGGFPVGTALGAGIGGLVGALTD